MEGKGDEEILDSLIQKIDAFKGKDEELVGLSVLLREGFYGRKPKVGTFKRMVDTIIPLIKNEERVYFRDLAISSLITTTENCFGSNCLLVSDKLEDLLVEDVNPHSITTDIRAAKLVSEIF